MSDEKPQYDTPVLRPVSIRLDAAGQVCEVETGWMVLRQGRVRSTEDGFMWQIEPDYWESCDPPEDESSA